VAVFLANVGVKSAYAAHSPLRAIPYAKPEAQRVFGATWRWLEHRPDLQTISSFIRAVHRLEGAGEEWLRTICQS
jgi:hypothetical protein